MSMRERKKFGGRLSFFLQGSRQFLRSIFFHKIIFLRLFIFVLIISWIFSGWPQLINFPPQIETVYAIQTGTPTGDISAGAWTDEGSVDNDGSLYTSIDEVSSDSDSSYILASTNTTAEVSLGALSDPGIHTGHEIHFWFRATGSGAPERIAVDLVQGTSVIESSGTYTNRSGTYLETTFTIAEVNAANITDYTNLRIRITSSNLSGSDTMLVTKAELQLPNANVAPSAPTQNAPANSATGVSKTPTFTMTTTDPDSDNLGYKVTIYSNSGCSAVVSTHDQSITSTGWSGTDASCTASPTSCYASGTQGNFVLQSGDALSNGTQYWWKASAKDPDGSGSFTDSATCNTFTTNKVPNAPTQDGPTNGQTGVSVTPTFTMTTTDQDSPADDLSYKVTIYSENTCTTVVSTHDQSITSTGWSGTDASCTADPTSCYASGTQGNFVLQSGDALSGTTQYWWKASAKDPDGSATFTNSATCNNFTTENPPTLSVDIVDSGGSSVASPAMSMNSVAYSASASSTSSGTFSVSSQKIRVNNETASAQWTLTIAADAGATAFWDGVSSDYDFNDAISGLLVDSDLSASTDSADLRTNGAGQDWWESRNDLQTLLTLDENTIGGNSTKKARFASSTTNNAYMSQQFSTTTQGFVAEWDIYVDDILDTATGDRGGMMLIGVLDPLGTNGPNSATAERFALMGFYKNGGGDTGTANLIAMEAGDTFADSSTWRTVTTGLNLDQWYTIRVEGNVNAGTYDVYVDNSLVDSNIADITTLAYVEYISFATWNDGQGTFYIDNVRAEKNDGYDADSLGGQMTIDPSGGTITPQSGCSSTGLTKGSLDSFVQGVKDSLTLLSAGATANTDCYWDFTTIDILQSIPIHQATDTYTIDMTLTVTAV